MTAKDRAQRDLAIRSAMADLIHDGRFGRFIDVLRDQREVVIEDFCSDRVTANERLEWAAKGELRAYQAIISTYEEYASRTADEPGEQ